MIENYSNDYRTNRELSQNNSENFDIKILKGKFQTFKRLRVGNYRIIFEEKNNNMYIYEIKHRQEAYND